MQLQHLLLYVDNLHLVKVMMVVSVVKLLAREDVEAVVVLVVLVLQSLHLDHLAVMVVTEHHQASVVQM
tara:strand:- start:265 stop:471 length:207 start_codon:yes stop_codon:yes gene_type:complete